MANPVSWVLDQIKRLNNTIWSTSQSAKPRWQTLLFRQARIFIVAAMGSTRDKVQLRASALTLYSILSIIPLVAIAFAIAKGFGLDKNLETIIIEKFSTQQELMNQILAYARSALEETRGGYIAGIGVIILFWSVMSLLENIERSFNHIWQVRFSRAWYRKFTDYLTIMIIAPIFMIFSSSITVFISTELTDFMSKAAILSFFKPVISNLIKFAPYFLSWITMTVLFVIMPNTKVKIGPALISGIIAGTLIQIIFWFYIDLQVGIAKLGKIYGGLAALPLFIVWIQSSWIVVLIGAELTFANQNIARYELEAEASNVSNHQKRILVLLLLQMIIRNFSLGEKPFSAENMALFLKIPVRLVRDILNDLDKANLVSLVQEDDELLYQPALDINKLTVSFVFSRLDRIGVGQIMASENADYRKVKDMLEKFDALIAGSDSNILIKDL